MATKFEIDYWNSQVLIFERHIEQYGKTQEYLDRLEVAKNKVSALQSKF